MGLSMKQIPILDQNLKEQHWAGQPVAVAICIMSCNVPLVTVRECPGAAVKCGSPHIECCAAASPRGASPLPQYSSGSPSFFINRKATAVMEIWTITVVFLIRFLTKRGCVGI